MSKWSLTSLRGAISPARSLSDALRALLGVACITGCAAPPVGAPKASGTQDCPAAPASAPKTNALPSVLKIDDFEDGNGEPITPLFASWQCYTYNTEAGTKQCHPVEHGFNSNYCEVFQFHVADRENGTPDYAGAGLRSITAAGTLDLSGYGRLTFTARLEADPTSPLPTNTALVVSLGCTAVSDGIVPSGFSVVNEVPITDGWATHSINLADFAQPDWQSVRIDPRRCITLVDGVAFAIQPALRDGGSAGGSLFVDNIYFQ